jgi:hypothetical protein
VNRHCLALAPSSAGWHDLPAETRPHWHSVTQAASLALKHLSRLGVNLNLINPIQVIIIKHRQAVSLLKLRTLPAARKGGRVPFGCY